MISRLICWIWGHDFENCKMVSQGLAMAKKCNRCGKLKVHWIKGEL